MENPNKKTALSKMLKTTNTTLDEIPADLLADVQNVRGMFARGFVSYDYIYIKEVKNTKPKDLDQFDQNLRESGSVFFYVLEMDKEKAVERRLWIGGKTLIICSISSGRCVPWYMTATDYHNRQASYSQDFQHLKTFWRKSDYEEARKCSRRVWVIYQNAHGGEILAKQEKRQAEKEWALVRHTVLACDLCWSSNQQAARISTLTTRTDRGQVKQLEGWRCYTYSSEYIFKTKEQALEYYFDKSGYIKKDNAQTLRQRTEHLKRQRARQRLTANNYEKETAELSAVYGLLVKSFKDLSDKFLDLTERHISHRVFWFTQRLEKTADAIQDTSELLDRIADKTFDGDLALFDAFNKGKDHALKVIAKNHAWLRIKDENRSNKENLEDNAIYYGYCDFTKDDSGNVNGVILDLEKAKQKLAERGY